MTRLIFSNTRLQQAAAALGISVDAVQALFDEHAAEIQSIWNYLESPGVADESLIASNALPGQNLDPTLVATVVELYLSLGLGRASVLPA